MMSSEPLFLLCPKEPDPLGQVRYLALPWSFVSKITNSKHPAKKTAGKQITNKSQIPIFNDQTFQAETLFGFLNFGYCDLFDICYLEFNLLHLR